MSFCGAPGSSNQKGRGEELFHIHSFISKKKGIEGTKKGKKKKKVLFLFVFSTKSTLSKMCYCEKTKIKYNVIVR